MKNYGVEHTFQCEENLVKRENSLFEKYGVTHNSQMDSVKISKKQFLDEELDDWKMYRRKCRRLLKKVRNEIFENWNGYDFYDNEYCILFNYPLPENKRCLSCLENELLCRDNDTYVKRVDTTVPR